MRSIKIITEETVGVVKIKEDCQFNKIRAEKVVVNENITARLFGTVKTIVIKKGAKLFLHGAISGSVKNHGGEIYVF